MMSRLYGEQHRSIQDDFGTRGMADRVEELVCRTEFDDGAKGFMESVEMFYLSSIDHQGRPGMAARTIGYRPTPQDITDFQVKLDAALRQAGY